MNKNMIGRAQESYATLCSLYGDECAQALMRTHGACHPRVARLAKKLAGNRAAIQAVREYRKLASLRPGLGRLAAAANGNRAVMDVVRAAGVHFSPWEVDTSITVAYILAT